jgi:hypothetical protein
MMPLDDTARDAVLAGWSRSDAKALRRVTVPSPSLTRTVAVLSGPRITVLTAKAVDSVLGEVGSPRSLLNWAD